MRIETHVENAPDNDISIDHLVINPLMKTILRTKIISKPLLVDAGIVLKFVDFFDDMITENLAEPPARYHRGTTSF